MLKRLFPVLLIFISMISVQGSASMAKTLFPVLGAAGVTAWRLLFSSLMLIVIFKPWRKPVSGKAWQFITLYGFALGFMNLFFYCAIARIPLGIAVAIELSGPIMVAMFASHRLADLIWLGLAVIGLSMLLPMHQANANLDPLGLLFALMAGCCWALYILFGRKASIMHGPSSVAIGSFIIACLLFPFGVWQAGSVMFSVDLLPFVFLVALLASAIPYGLDMIALPKLPAQTFSTLMSLSPVFAALSGFIFLDETVTFYQWIAIAFIIVSSIGSVLGISRKNEITVVKQPCSKNNHAKN